MHNPNPFITPDITAKVDEIMARNRALYAGWTMEADGAGAGGDAGDAGGSADGAGAGGDEGADQLGDAGKKALDRMKADKRAAERRAAAAEAELEKVRTAGLSEQEKAVALARKEGETEATTKANARLVRAEAKALAAAAKFRDAGDVIAQLGDQLSSIPVDEDGEVDQDALKALVDDLAKKKPYLVDSGTTTATAADAGIGTTGTKQSSDPGPGRSRLRAAIEAGSKK